MSESGLGWYLNTIGRVPLLTPAEELHLGQLVRAWQDHPDGPDDCPAAVRRRGLRARDRFVQANLRLAVSYVSNRCSRLVPPSQLEDLIQATTLGLIRAVERFDPARGYKFSTYAYWWCRQAANRYLDLEVRLVKIPGHHSQLLTRIAAAAREHLVVVGRQPTVEELSLATGLDAARIRGLLEESRAPTSLDQGVNEDLALGDLLPAAPPTEAPDETPELLQVRRGLQRLAPQVQQVLALRYGLEGKPLSANETADTLGLVPRQVRQLEREGLAVLRQPEEKSAPEAEPPVLGDQLGLKLGPEISRPGKVFRRRSCGHGSAKLQLRHTSGKHVDQLLLLVQHDDPTICQLQ